MGYEVSTIENLPNLSGYYFFIFGDYDCPCYRTEAALYNRFSQIARRIGRHSAIVKMLDDEMLHEFSSCFYDALWKVDVFQRLIMREPSFLIMNKHPNKFTFSEDNVFVLVPFEVLDELYDNDYDFVRDVISLGANGDNTFLEKLHSLKKPGIIKRLGDSFMLEPNFNGLGINLKKLFSKKTYLVDEFDFYVYKGHK